MHGFAFPLTLGCGLPKNKAHHSKARSRGGKQGLRVKRPREGFLKSRTLGALLAEPQSWPCTLQWSNQEIEHWFNTIIESTVPISILSVVPITSFWVFPYPVWGPAYHSLSWLLKLLQPGAAAPSPSVFQDMDIFEKYRPVSYRKSLRRGTTYS